MGSSRLEVEAKARVASPAEMRRRLDAIGRPLGEIVFQDTYFAKAPADKYTGHRFRLRLSEGRATVTAKERSSPRGCEVSREHEFEVSNPEAFEAFARMFGFAVLIEKVKRGGRWDVGGGAKAELVEIVGLGWFLEIEVMVDEESEVAPARERVLGLFKDLGIGPDELEREPYTKMLFERRQSGKGL